MHLHDGAGTLASIYIYIYIYIYIRVCDWIYKNRPYRHKK